MRDEAAVSRQRLLAAFLRLYRARDVDFIAGETITYGDQGEVGGQGPRSNRDAANPPAVRQYPRSGGTAQPARGAARILCAVPAIGRSEKPRVRPEWGGQGRSQGAAWRQ